MDGAYADFFGRSSMLLRFCQSLIRREYIVALGVPMDDQRQWHGGDTIPRYCVTAGQWPWIVQIIDSQLGMHGITWGFLPPAGDLTGIRPLTEVGIDKAMSGRYLRHMWTRGRAIVPIDGWFEVAAGLPWFVRLASRAPMFVPVVTNSIGQHSPPSGAGFVILVTSEAAGLVDARQRRPVILTPEHARRWLDPEMPAQGAESLARCAPFPAKAFEWHKVDPELYAQAVNDRRIVAGVDQPSQL
jgi:putative SOS response-associated peptidase YedK